MTAFNLRQTVRDMLTESDVADPGRIAEMVMVRIAPDDHATALSQALRLFVRQVISETRTGNAPTNVTPILSRGRSWKATGIRDGWQRRLNDRIHVGDSDWKLLGDCTYDDLIAAASERQQLADRNAAWARTYRAFAAALRDTGAATFRELPAEQQMHLLGGAA